MLDFWDYIKLFQISQLNILENKKRKFKISMINRMRNVFLFSLLMCLLNGYSQTSKESDAEISISKPYVKDRYPNIMYEFILENRSNVLRIYRNKKVFSMQLYDAKTLRVEQTKDVTDFPEGYSFETVIRIKNNYYLFYSLWDQNKQNEKLYSREINTKNLTFNGPDRLWLTVKGKITNYSNDGPIVLIGGYAGSIYESDKFDILLSSDSSKVLVKYRKESEIVKDKKNKDVIGLFVFDNNLNPLWGNEYTMPYTEASMDNLSYVVNSNGNVSLLAIVYDDNSDKKKRDKGKSNFHLEVLSVESKSTILKISKVDIGDKYIANVLMKEGVDNQIVCAGFYSENAFIDMYEKINEANGVFLCKIDKNGEVKDIQTFKIPIEILNQNMSEKDINKSLKGKKISHDFRNWESRNLHVNKDGSILFVGEQNYIIDNSSKSYYTYNDILISKIDNNGQLAWMKKIPKRQNGFWGPGNMSFAFIPTEDLFYFIYLDNVNNMNISLNAVPEKLANRSLPSEGVLIVNKLDYNTGNISKKLLFNTDGITGLKSSSFFARSIVKLKYNELIMVLYRDKKGDDIEKGQVLVRANFDSK